MAEDVRDEVDVAGGAVEARAVGAAELVGRDVLEGGHLLRVLLDQVLDSADGDAAVLQGEEEGVLVSVFRKDLLAFLEICLQRLPDLVAEIDDRVVAALAVDPDPVLAEIDVLQVQADALADADPGAEKKRQHRDVADPRALVKSELPLRELRAVIDLLQERPHFALVQPDDGLLVALGERDQRGHVAVQDLRAVEVAEHAAERGELPGLATLVIRVDLAVFLVIGEVLQIFLDVLLADAAEHLDVVRGDLPVLQGRVGRAEEFEEDAQVIGVSETGPGGGRLLDPAEVSAAETREGLQDFSHFRRIFDILFFGVSFGSLHRHGREILSW